MCEIEKFKFCLIIMNTTQSNFYSEECTVDISEDTSKHHRGVVLNAINKMCIIDIRIINDHHDHEPVCFYEGPKTENITWMDLNMKSREVYFSVNNILYR